MASFDLLRLVRHTVNEKRRLRRAFPPEALRQIETEIAALERTHSGEMRFAVEAGLGPWAALRGLNAQQRAKELFASLRVWETERRNGVLVYLLLADHAVEVVADSGIHALAGSETWNAVVVEMQAHFASGRFGDGVVAGLRRIAGVLAEHFPRREGDVNELPDAPVVL